MPGHPLFAADQREAALDFFAEQNYTVIADALTSDDVGTLLEFMDRSQAERPVEWNVGKGNVLSHTQILILHPELDRWIKLPTIFPIVEQIMGPDVRFGQFDFRSVPVDIAVDQPMAFHRDRKFAVAEGQMRRPGRFSECSYVCSIVYLTDVDDVTSPAFTVVPNSHPAEYGTYQEARQKMGSAFAEVPIIGPAGTCVLYNIHIYHTRGARRGARRTLHHYYSCQSSPPLTNWVMIPQRLTEHADPGERAYFSQWTDATRAYAEAGYIRQHYDDHVMEKR